MLEDVTLIGAESNRELFGRYILDRGDRLGRSSAGIGDLDSDGVIILSYTDSCVCFFLKFR